MQNVTSERQFALNQKTVNTPPPGSRITANLFSNPQSLMKSISKFPLQKNEVDLGINNSLTSQINTVCADTSYTRLLGIYNGSIYVRSVTKTQDEGMLVTLEMYDTTRPNPSWRNFGILVKLNESGNVNWVKQFEDLSPGNFSSLIINNAFELPNHDIICTGGINTNGTSNVYDAVVYRLTSTGNLIWKNCLKTNIDIFNSAPGTFSFNINDAIEGLNGDVLLCGTSNSNLGSGHIETVAKLNNLGGLVWDANFGNHGTSYSLGAEGTKVFLKNGQVVLMGLSHGTNNPQIPSAVNFFTLDYGNGNLLSKRFFRPQYSDLGEEFLKSFTYYNNKAEILNNGHIIFHGKLFSDFANLTTTINHFGVIEFDNDYNLVNAYTINSNKRTNYYNNNLFFDKTGKGLVSIFEYVNSYEGNIYFGAFNDLQFLKQRKVEYTNTGMGGYNGFAFLNDNGYAYLQTHYQDQPFPRSYFEFKKMHNSDTSSLCLGKDTTLLNFLPFNIVEDPAYFYWNPNDPNKIISLLKNISLTDTISSNSIELCRQINHCDTVKIHGNSVICGSAPSVTFTSFKNPACGGITNWTVDNNVIDSMKTLNDSSVRIWFKNINWQGKLYASLPTGACNTPATDSMFITIIVQQSLNLGIDTTLCNGNTMILHAGNTFSNYQWQDGSADSTFTVHLPGTYYVTTSDLCGNALSDTIHIAGAYFPFSIGNDTIRCNNDTIVLNATPGFNNYQWHSNYNISSTTGQSVRVYPQVDTFYYAYAEKWPGCVVTDTINIKVRNSPAIFLGADTSLCTGQILTLDAGSGFTGYVWNTGGITQQITANQAGIYSVKATAANSCISYDTLRILNVSPVPQFTLGADTSICSGKVYNYAFNLPNATYLWQDGSTNNIYVISQPGQYTLQITQTGCANRDTVLITYKQSPTVNLGSDTSICIGRNYLLDAFYPSATYMWQDGSVQPQFLVNQTGTYKVAISLNGCTFRDTINVNYIPNPVFNLGNDTAICIGQSILLAPVLNTPVSYLWSNGSSSPSFNVTEPGIFSLIASNKCSSFTDVISITEGLCKLILPNSFTPNGDGLNDKFGIKYPFTVKLFEFSIYNRYGERIFETANMGQSWDGTYKSIKQETGGYIWVIKIKGLDDVIETKTGTVMLIR